jgi:hypothetical protein
VRIITEVKNNEVKSLGLFENYIGPMELKQESNYHEERKSMYHISSLTLCAKKTFLDQCKKVKKTPLDKGVLHIGKSLHKEIQKGYLRKHAFSQIETIVQYKHTYDSLNNEKSDLIVTGKIDILDFENSRIIDIKTSKADSFEKLKNEYKKAKDDHINQILTYLYIWNYLEVRDPNSFKWIKSAGVIYINKENYEDIYFEIDCSKSSCEKAFKLALENAILIDKAFIFKDYSEMDSKCVFSYTNWLCRGFCAHSKGCNYYGQKPKNLEKRL